MNVRGNIDKGNRYPRTAENPYSYKKRNSIHRDKHSCIPIVLILIILTEITILSIYL